MDNRSILVVSEADRQKKDARQRLTYFADWLTACHLHWYEPDLDKYRDYLFKERTLSASSVAAHLGAVRSRYRFLLAEGNLLNLLREVFQEAQNSEDLIEHALTKMKEATSSSSGRVALLRKPNIRHLSTAQIQALLAAPDMRTLQGVRDCLCIGLMLCTGITETELSELDRTSIVQNTRGRYIVKISRVAARASREVPIFDDLIFSAEWIGMYFHTWVRHTSLTEGPLLLGFYKGGHHTSQKRITPRAIQKLLKQYALQAMPSSEHTVTSLELRRTFARNLYIAGIEVEDLHKYLGNTAMTTTLEYIGQPTVGSSGHTDPRPDGTALLQRIREYLDT